jgi:hypothetical protein
MPRRTSTPALTVNGGGSAAGDPLLIEYDKAAQAAVDFYERR